jgi:DNA modification methylase
MTSKNLQDHMLGAYADTAESLSNDALYRSLSDRAGIAAEDWRRRINLGPGHRAHSELKRRVRWYQQTLRELGIIERDPARGRGFWRLTPKGRDQLTPAKPKKVLLGFSTDLGVALWAAAGDVFSAIDEPIVLCLTSPPYPLAAPRAYGNPNAIEYVDWVCRLLEPIAKHLVPGGSLCLNVSNDIFEPGSPARSLYRERLVIALCERLGLAKLDEFIWHNPTKAPGPTRWASITRQQLNVAWEPVYWFTNAPALVRADNRRVLQCHAKRHLDLMRVGGEKRTANNGDGAYRLYPGSYGNATPGRIPRNVLSFPHRCASKDAAARAAKAQGLPVHAATMPLPLARFLVDFLTEPGDLVVDPCAGWLTTALAAEDAGCRWLCTEQMGEYVLGASNRFTSAPGFRTYGKISGFGGVP